MVSESAQALQLLKVPAMAERSKQEAAWKLRERLSKTHQAYRDANSRLNIAATETDQLPPPDGTSRILQADSETRIAFHRYMNALRESTDFVLSGSIPDDLFLPK